jgi:hypothetical protein
MVDSTGLFSFLAGPDPNATTNYPAMEARRRMALALMAGNARKPYPKTLGEGLSAIGDALGQRAMMSQLAQQEAGFQRQSGALLAPPPAAAAGTPQKTSFNAPAASAAPVMAADDETDDGGNVQTAADTSAPGQAGPVLASDTGPPAVNPRDLVTAALMQQRPGMVPQPNPTGPGDQPPDTIPSQPTADLPGGRPMSDQRLALADTGTMSDAGPILPSKLMANAMPTDIQPAPPMPSEIRRMPQQIAQATPSLPDSQMPPAVPSPETPPQPYTPPPNAGPLPAPPPIPAKGDPQLYKERQLQQAKVLGDPMATAALQSQVDLMEQARQENYKNLLNQWEYRSKLPAATLQQREAELALAKKVQDEELSQRLGNVNPANFEAMLNKNHEALSGLPAATNAIRLARDLNEKMYHGSAAEFDTTVAKLANTIGIPLDPRVAATEKFKVVMTALLGQGRKGVEGTGTQSNAELDLLIKSIAADPRLTGETIASSLDNVEKMNLQGALQHQQLVRRFAGDDPNRQSSVYGMYGVPGGMANLVPQGAVDKLKKNMTNPDGSINTNAHREFDNAFHTPGLSREILRMRR